MLKKIKKHPGMVLSASIVILSILAIYLFSGKPAHDQYNYRAEVSRCVAQGSVIKMLYTEHYLQNGKPPKSLADLDYSYSHEASPIDEVVIRNNGYDLRCAADSDTVTIQHTYTTVSGEGLRWSCSSETPSHLAPVQCY